MSTFRFAQLPSNASIASAVTLLVCGWFALAGGAILTDQHSEATIEMARSAPVRAEAAPDARFTIVVSARRATTG